MIKIGKSNIAGQGVLATQNIPKGKLLGLTHVFKQGGILASITDLGKKHNHSTTPNAASIRLGNHRYIYTIKPIKSGDEITVDYRKQPELEQPKDNWKNV
jgi:hypothetical protein